jgi:hypothetical protein
MRSEARAVFFAHTTFDFGMNGPAHIVGEEFCSMIRSMRIHIGIAISTSYGCRNNRPRMAFLVSSEGKMKVLDDLYVDRDLSLFPRLISKEEGYEAIARKLFDRKDLCVHIMGF